MAQPQVTCSVQVNPNPTGLQYSGKFRAFSPYGDEIIVAADDSGNLTLPQATGTLVRIEYGIATLKDWNTLGCYIVNGGDSLTIAYTFDGVAWIIGVLYNGSPAARQDCP